MIKLPVRYTGEHYGDNGGRYREIVDADGDPVLGECGTPSAEECEQIVSALNATQRAEGVPSGMVLVKKETLLLGVKWLEHIAAVNDPNRNDILPALWEPLHSMNKDKGK